MSSFAEFIAQNYESSVELIWDYPARGRAVARFAIDTLKATVSFEQRESNGAWHVAFEVADTDVTHAARSSFALFNGVFQATREFLEVREPQTVVFAATDARLAQIYRTYLHRESGNLTRLGYRTDERRIEPFTEYVLTRMTPSAWRE